MLENTAVSIYILSNQKLYNVIRQIMIETAFEDLVSIIKAFDSVHIPTQLMLLPASSLLSRDITLKL